MGSRRGGPPYLLLRWRRRGGPSSLRPSPVRGASCRSSSRGGGRPASSRSHHLVRDPPTGDPLPGGTALQLRVVDRRRARRRSSPHELEVEDDPDMWVPHVSEMKERKVKGQSCLYENTPSILRLQVGLIRRRAYIMAYLQQQRNCNGSGIVSRIIMVFFKIVTFIMA
jgi:hypothetical protein